MRKDALELHTWYLHHRRDLPWRKNRDAYRIWISESMLQQTTVAAVAPYFERFIKRFPKLEVLSAASESDVLDAWSGLGYYRRARLLHHAAKALVARGGFPRTAKELEALPGFGPYTSRAVASLAFDEPVGVVDGNVIRVLTRFHGLDISWWESKSRRQLQILADRWVEGLPSHEVNQALMELGATICSVKNPLCSLCPVAKNCVARKEDRQGSLPRNRPRPEKEIWHWRAQILQDSRGRIALVRNEHLPFLKGSWLLPGLGQKVTKRPSDFDFKHAITRFEIYVNLSSAQKSSITSKHELKWVLPHQIPRVNPTSLITKALKLSIPVLAALIVLGCRTMSGGSAQFKDKRQPEPPSGVELPVAERLTNDGENCCGVMTPDSETIYFLSRNRPRHSQFQIYSMNFKNRQDRRISFHNGDDQGLALSSSGRHLLYASTTDEEKEFPAFFNQSIIRQTGSQGDIKSIPIGPRPFWTNQPFELYRSGLRGENIERLTVRPGFDAEPSENPRSKRIAFVSARDGTPRLYLLQPNLQAHRWGHEKLPAAEPQWSPTGKEIAWVRFAQDYQSSQVMISDEHGRSSREITSGPGLKLSPRWDLTGERLVFSSNLEDPENYEIYLAKTDGSCTSRLTYALGNDLLPQFSPSSNELVWTSDRTGTLQLYIMKINLAGPGSCEEGSKTKLRP